MGWSIDSLSLGGRVLKANDGNDAEGNHQEADAAGDEGWHQPASMRGVRLPRWFGHAGESEVELRGHEHRLIRRDVLELPVGLGALNGEQVAPVIRCRAFDE